MNDLFPDAPIPIQAQIKEIERDLAHRERVYPRLIRIGQLSEATANGRLLIVRAAARTLKAIAAITPPRLVIIRSSP